MNSLVVAIHWFDATLSNSTECSRLILSDALLLVSGLELIHHVHRLFLSMLVKSFLPLGSFIMSVLSLSMLTNSGWRGTLVTLIAMCLINVLHHSSGNALILILCTRWNSQDAQVCSGPYFSW